MGKNLLITGIDGQDGSYLAELAKSRGWNCYGSTLALPLINIEKSDFEIMVGDVSDKNFLKDLLQWARPDAICHLAGITSVSESWLRPVDTFQVNFFGTLNLMELLLELRISPKLILAGSSEMFDPKATLPWSEATAIEPKNPYGQSKAALFRVANIFRDHGLNISTAILFNHESPRRPETFVTKRIARQAAEVAIGRRGKILVGNLEVKRDWGYAPDFVDALERMISDTRNLDLVLATGAAISVQAFVEASLSALGISCSDVEIESDPQLMRPNDVPEMYGDASRALETIGWRATTKGREVAALLALHEYELMRK